MKWTALILSLLFAACSGDPATFVSYSQKSNPGAFDPARAPRRTDALALNYANSVEEIFRARSTGARYTREASDTALIGLAAFAGAAKTLDIGAAKLVKMGMASAGILELRTIFDAKGRSTAYFEAAERIHAAIKDFGAHNLNNVSETTLSPNGWTLVNVVQSNIDIVNKILGGHLPSPEALAQAREPMSDKGALPQALGSTPANNIPVSTVAVIPQREPISPLPPDSLPPALPGTRPMRKQIVALLSELQKSGVPETIVAANGLTPESSTESPEATVCKAILAKASPVISGINPTVSDINLFQRSASPEQLIVLKNAIAAFVKIE